MSNQTFDKKTATEKNKDIKTTTEKDKEFLEPDPETLHKTDPQEEMKGPVSSFIQGVKHEAEKGDKESKEEATKRKDENT